MIPLRNYQYAVIYKKTMEFSDEPIGFTPIDSEAFRDVTIESENPVQIVGTRRFYQLSLEDVYDHLDDYDEEPVKRWYNIRPYLRRGWLQLKKTEKQTITLPVITRIVQKENGDLILEWR